MNGALSFDLYFCSCHQLMTAYFQTLSIFSKNKSLGTLEIVNPRVASDEISEIRPSGR